MTHTRTLTEPDRMTVAECRQLVGVSRNAVYKRIKAGLLVTERKFGRLVVARRAADAWKQERELRAQRILIG